MRLSARIAAMAVAIGLVTPGLSARQLSPRNASYTLQATLEPATHRITGRGRLTWRNIAAVPATELRFHLFWNAWRSDTSTFFRELGGPMAARTANDPGSIDITALSLVTATGTVDLRPRIAFLAPDDGNPEDRTVVAVTLDTPITPGGVVDIDMGWTSRVPRTYARTGVLGNYFFIGHWFPKIAVFQDAGWNSHQFHAATEFFADYGVYDVSVTVPTGWVIGATGREQSAIDNRNGTTTHRFVQADVHDFAWTTSPEFRDVRRRLHVPGTKGIDVRLLLQPEHEDQIDRHLEATTRALTKFSEWFGPYPHGTLTVVDPVTVVNADAQGDDTGGMEYPTILTAGTRWSMPWRHLDPEDVIIHEIAHQYWQGIVGNNEFEHAWMDEGLTTYVTGRVMAESYPGRFYTVSRYFGDLLPWTYFDVPWSRDVDSNYVLTYREAPDWDAPAKPSWQYGKESTGAITYAKPALWLMSLERLFGWEMVRQTLAGFYARAQFRHPEPEELFAAASSAAGRDLTWFFDTVHRSAATFDYAVADVSHRRVSGGTESRVVVRRLREGVFPVEVRVTFEDGWTASERWDGRDRWREFTYVRRSGVRTVEVDPTRVLTLDLNYTNNSWTAEPRAREVAERWSVRWMTWLQTVLLTYAFFA